MAKSLLMLMSFFGIIIIYLDSLMSETLVKSDLIGMSLMIGSAFIYSITIIIFKIEGKNRNHYEITYFQNLAAVPIFLIAIFLK